MRRTNARGIEYMYFCGEQKTIESLQEMEDLPCQMNIRKSIPLLPKIEFHISKVAHVTTLSGLNGILDAGGFQGRKQDLLWWGLAVEEEDIKAAEERFLEETYPGRELWQKNTQTPFLHKFTTSPVFKTNESRYGNFKFLFSLWDLLQMYSEQICGGVGPVMRVYGTSVYRREIMYTVIVHSPSEKEFERYPGLCEDDAICVFENHNIIWKAQALSKDHYFQAVTCNERPQVIEAEPFAPLYDHDRWFVWDHVTVAFHLPEGQTLRVSRERLIQNLTACEAADPFLGVRCGQQNYNCTCNCCRLPLPEAQRRVEQLKKADERQKQTH